MKKKRGNKGRHGTNPWPTTSPKARCHQKENQEVPWPWLCLKARGHGKKKGMGMDEAGRRMTEEEKIQGEGRYEEGERKRGEFVSYSNSL